MPKVKRKISWREIYCQAKPSSFFTSMVSVPLSVPLVHVCYLCRLTPNMVSSLSFLVLAGGLAGFALNPTFWPNVIFMALMFQIAYSLDAADGILARLTNRSSTFGAWYDLVLDRLGHVLVVGGVMLAYWPGASSHIGYLSYHASFVALLMVSLAYHNAVNLKTALYGNSHRHLNQPSQKDYSLFVFSKNLITASCDYNFFLVMFAFSFLSSNPLWIIWLLTGFHVVGLTGQIYVTSRDRKNIQRA